MSDIEEHQAKLMAAFAAILQAEEAVSEVKARKQQAETMLSQELNGKEAALEKVLADMEALLGETGEFEVFLPGEVTDFKIGFSTPRETVKADPEATPDAFCKTERKPKLKEIGEHLKALREAGADLPNWATFQLGQSKLQWKAIKKTNRKD